MTQAQKTLLLWMLLIVMMVAIWSLVGRDGGDGREAAGGAFLYIVPIALGIIGLVWFLSRGTVKANAANQEGVRLLGLGRVSAALERFRAATTLRDQPVFRFNAAVAETQLFRLDSALGQLAQLAKTRHPDPFGSMIREQTALVRVLMGTASHADVAGFRDQEAALTRLLAACVTLREGRFAQAETILAEPVIKQLGGWLRALSDALSAWCALELRGERRPVDRAALFGEADPEGLLQHWPELRAFLDQAP